MVGRELREPPFDLAFEEALGAAEVGEPDGAPVDRVDLDQRVDQLLDRAVLGFRRGDPRFGDATAHRARRRSVPSRRTAARRPPDRRTRRPASGRARRSPSMAVRMRYSRSTSWARAVFAWAARAAGPTGRHRVRARTPRTTRRRPSARRRGERDRRAARRGRRRACRRRRSVTAATAGARPAAARSSAHFSSAAGRRLGMCSVGQPSTGR